MIIELRYAMSCSVLVPLSRCWTSSTKCGFHRVSAPHKCHPSVTSFLHDYSPRSGRSPGRSSNKQTLDDKAFKQLIEGDEDAYAKEIMRVPGMAQRVFLVQPKIYGTKNFNPVAIQLLLEENKTLLDTLGWQVVDSLIMNVASLESTYVFGSGNFEKLQEAIKAAPAVSSIFVGHDILKAKQLRTFKEVFQMPIYDRYRIVLEIFRAHAKTREAKLQIALAELPYIRSCLLGFHQQPSDIGLPVMPQHSSGGGGETWRQTQNNIVREREGQLKAELERVRENRARTRENRIKNQIPSIAVVGYTNAGKTSLIKTLTNDKKLIPEDKLFATLDVTSHAGNLPNNVHILYVDTIGFISDMPTVLIASFGTVLEEVALADVIVHIRDISHPDTVKQKETVLQQLRDLKLPEKLLDSVIEACNKCDKIPREKLDPVALNVDPNAIFTSATNNIGIFELRQKMEEVLMNNSDLAEKVFRVPQSGKELGWLYQEAHIHKVEADPSDSEFLIVRCTITAVAFARFVHQFRKIQVRNIRYTPPVFDSLEEDEVEEKEIKQI